MDDPQEIIKSFNTLKKNLKKDYSALKKIRIALLGDSSTQLLTQSIKAYGYEECINFEIYESDYNQIEQQIVDSASELYQFQPQFVVIFQSTKRLAKNFYKKSSTQKKSFAQEKIAEVNDFYSTITNNLKAKIIYFNFQEINDNVFGNFSNKTEQSFLYQLRKINFELMDLSIRCKNMFICDYNLINLQHGSSFCFDAKMYYTADMVLSIDVLPWVAKNITDIVSSISGKFKKCLILDLDNTLWGGIIGDDGIENIQIGDLGLGKAFTELQLWIRQLKERGIILAVCSKNTESVAKEPFQKHPDMLIKLDDIAVFVANWENKADNIKYIQNILNIGFDSMVFLDDNPFERNMVRTNIPEITVPELPEDPALYLEYILKLNLFETASLSEEDEHRTKQYQEEAGRVIAKRNFVNEDDFLASLTMTSEVRAFDKFNIPRVAQLSQRSNQFNLRTVRYTDEDVQKLSVSKEHDTFIFNLKDKYGDNGFIAIIILQKQVDSLFIDTWLMSCRVLKRGMENFTLNTIVEHAKKGGYKKIIGEYIPTSKNEMVKDHYEKLGFVLNNNLWELNITSYQNKQCFIELI